MHRMPADVLAREAALAEARMTHEVDAAAIAAGVDTSVADVTRLLARCEQELEALVAMRGAMRELHAARARARGDPAVRGSAGDAARARAIP